MAKYLLILMMALALPCGCMTDMTHTEIGNPAAARRILILSQDTGFKQRLIYDLVHRPASRDWYYLVWGLDKIDEVDISKFDAVIVLSPIKGGVVDQRVAHFLEKYPKNPKLIVCYTYRFESLKTRIRWDYEIDAISSASINSAVPCISEKLVNLVSHRQEQTVTE